MSAFMQEKSQRETQEKTSQYERDFYAWLLEQAQLLRNGQLRQLDKDNIAEELEGLARTDKHKLESHTIRLLMHLLKWQFQTRRRSRSWLLTIREARRRVTRLLQDSPSLKPFIHEIFADCYARARGDAAAETGLSLKNFPAECPYTLDQVLDENFLPTGDDQS